MKIENRHFVIAAAVVSIVLLAAATIGGKDSPAEVFVSSVGALGQVWIALMLWHLTRQQFEHSKSSSEREARISVYELRSTLLDDWRKYSLQIGYTAINEDNVKELRRLRQRIERLFGKVEMEMAKVACDAANAANKRARQLAGTQEKLNEDLIYRGHIDRFKQAQQATWVALEEKTSVDN